MNLKRMLWRAMIEGMVAGLVVNLTWYLIWGRTVPFWVCLLIGYIGGSIVTWVRVQVAIRKFRGQIEAYEMRS